MRRVTICLCGGLGNQLFGYAFGRALAERHGARLRLDCRSAYLHDPYHHIALLDKFPAMRAELVNSPLLTAVTKIGYRLQSPIENFLPLQYRPIIREGPPTRYLEELHHFPYSMSVYFIGYWQSPRYFDDISVALRIELAPPPPTDAASLRMLDAIRSCPSCFVHFRSYNEEAGTNRHDLAAYYRTAIRRMQQSHPSLHFYLFSDDCPQAARLLSDVGSPMTVVDIPSHRGNLQSLADFYLMHACEHSIIGNSSFSWWAAWLNRMGGHEVIAPAGLSPLGDDWLPDSWTPIEVAHHA